MGKKKETAVVLSQERIGAGIMSLWLQTKEIAKEAAPGQFVSVYCKDGTRLLPRPISLCEIDRENKRLRLVYRIAGKGTEEFSHLAAGDSVDLLGPLGNGFPIQEGKALIVGGGIGVPPMLELARTLPGEKVLVMGYRDETYLEEELRNAGPLLLATEDGSKGTKGTVLDAIRENSVKADVLYACGPTPMLRKTADAANAAGVFCQVSLEERMGCGVGACLVCACKTRRENGEKGYSHVCKDGPVFNAKEVVW